MFMIPARKDNDPLHSFVSKEGYIYIRTNSGARVLELNHQSITENAREIANALEAARDAGFRQCQDAIRSALGLR